MQRVHIGSGKKGSRQVKAVLTDWNIMQQTSASLFWSEIFKWANGSGGLGVRLKVRSPVWSFADQTGCDKWLQHLSLSAAVLEGGRPSRCELHHPNNIILFMRFVDRSHVWLAWGSAQVNWKLELCNGAGSWADIVPLVITQEACVSVYRLHLRFTAPVWEWNIRGQVMDVSISSPEAVEMDHSHPWTLHIH